MASKVKEGQGQAERTNNWGVNLGATLSYINNTNVEDINLYL